jgi:protein TonB
MRTRTFILSFLVHATALCAAAVVRIFAATELPDPPRSTSFMMTATTVVPDVAPPPAPRQQAAASAVSHTAVPLAEPESIAPELPGDIPDVVPVDGALPGRLGDFAGGLDIGPPAPPGPRVGPPPPPASPMRVGGVVRPPQKIHHVTPAYPAIAQAARISGTVTLEALIGEDGSVREVKVLRSVALLDAPAIDAVRQWRFTPTLLNGVPVQVIMSVTVTFGLR